MQKIKCLKNNKQTLLRKRDRGMDSDENFLKRETKILESKKTWRT